MATLAITGYAPGQFRLTAQQRRRVQKFWFDNNDSDPMYIVNGFSSSSADHELNFALSTDRANEVAKFLIELGTPNDKIAERAFGERRFSGNSSQQQVTRSVTIVTADS